MSNQITNYVCPACGGPLHFSESTGKVVCDYCDSAYDIQYIEQYYAEKDAKAAEAKAASDEKGEAPSEAEWNSVSNEDWGEDGKKLKLYSCPSCRAQLVCDDTTGASSCPYCGNPTIVPGKLSGSRRPDFVIPFQLSKEAALEALKKHYRGKPLLPKAFSEENHIEKIQGVYVPFWLFDAGASGNFTFNATRTHMHSTPTENITETDHYLLTRAGTMEFSRIPADASRAMPDALMDAIEPFDYGHLKPFALSYLPGFLADRYDVSQSEVFGRIRTRCEGTFSSAIQATTAGYATCVPVRRDVHITPRNVKYAMLPVWLLATRWNGKSFLFAMNGQTGRLVGDLPIDKGRLAAWCAGVGLAVSALSLLFLL